MRGLRLVAVAGLVLSVSLTTASAGVHYVDVAGGADFTAIKPAVQAAADGDTIYVAAGTYSGPDNRLISFGAKNLKLIATFGAVMDCEGQGWGIALSGSWITHDSLISGMTIRNGVARDFAEDGGGGILCQSEASPVIEYCTIENCDGVFGGGIKLLNSDAIVRYSWIKDCTADYGGAISTSGGGPLFDLVHVWGNVATLAGGAIRCYNGEPNFNRLNIILNEDTSRGAAVKLDGSTIAAAFTRCIVAFSTSGGAIIGGSTGTVSHCIVYGNEGGDTLPAYAGDNLFEDPYFCDVYSYSTGVCDASSALNTVNAWGEYIGYVNVGCSAPCVAPVEASTWGRVKALYR